MTTKPLDALVEALGAEDASRALRDELVRRARERGGKAGRTVAIRFLGPYGPQLPPPDGVPVVRPSVILAVPRSPLFPCPPPGLYVQRAEGFVPVRLASR